jgi:7-keto-8-aminopelargonate synthetase-like enzyme
MKAHPELVQMLHARSAFFLDACKKHGLDTGMSSDSAVVPVIVGNSIECLHLSEQLAQRDINVQPIVYPAVDDSESRLRFFLSSTHTEAELSHTAQVVAEELGRIRAGAAAE